MRATLGLTNRIARELLTSGTYADLEGALTGTDVNRMLA
jgi:hypothetical protein